jgi:hypothetical protein
MQSNLNYKLLFFYRNYLIGISEMKINFLIAIKIFYIQAKILKIN